MFWEEFVMKKKICKLFDPGNIDPISRMIVKWSVIISCLFLASSLLVEVASGEFTAYTYADHYLAAELYRIPQSILLASFIAAAVISGE